jgi:hypothetical protein
MQMVSVKGPRPQRRLRKIFGWSVCAPGYLPGTPTSRGAGCEAHKSGSVRGAPGRPGVPTRRRTALATT